MHIKKHRSLVLILIDAVAFWSIVALSRIAYMLMDSSRSSLHYFVASAVLFVAIFASRLCLRVYNNVWRYANSRAYLTIIVADLLGGIIGFTVCYFANPYYLGAWLSVSIVSGFALVSLTLRFIYQQRYRHLNTNLKNCNKIGVAIVGAGKTGAMLAEEILYDSRARYNPICFIDVNPEKIGSRIHGIKVIEENESIVETLSTMPIQEILIAIPEMDTARMQQLLDIYRPTNCKILLYDFPLRDSTEMGRGKRQLREINIEDLLFRDALKINGKVVNDYYSGKSILVTGGGGSIGSELCRQIAKLKPKKLIIFDIYENNAYDLQQELKIQYGDKLDLAVEIGSVRDVARLEAIFDYYRPQIVFHAAAHKHVPLMEHSGIEAIKNNVIGTYNSANAAEKYGVEKFILISTDKAVNPTNIMGASKRLCEMIVQCRTGSKTSFTAVRFGNVLGSNGSVIPLFKRQIAAGGPITLTDKRIIRYFMTIPEASQLVMHAGAMAKNGELFVLDMGKPVRILDLAENIIRLSGLTPYKDIDIVEIGLRPGEKLYEELLIKTEDLRKTDNDLIFIEHDTPMDATLIERNVQELIALCKDNREIGSESIKAALRKIVPTYQAPEEVNRHAEESAEMKATYDKPSAEKLYS